MADAVDLGSRFLSWEERGATAWVTIDRRPGERARDSRKPVIAALNGLCMGGGLLITPRARVASKRLINARYGVVDRITFDESVHGNEVVEGFTAFIEKRPPASVPAEPRAEGRA